MVLRDRQQAGELLAEMLQSYEGKEGVVYALPRGGVVLGAIIAERLQMPLDLLIPRKVGAPFNPEFAISAVTEGGEVISDPFAVAEVSEDWLQQEIEQQRAESKRRRDMYLKGRKEISVKGKIAIIVDDGIATGLTMLAALADLRTREPARIAIAIPVMPPESVKALSQHVHELIALDIPAKYQGSVGAYYQDFEQVEDTEVIKLLGRFT